MPWSRLCKDRASYARSVSSPSQLKDQLLCQAAPSPIAVHAQQADLDGIDLLAAHEESTWYRTHKSNQTRLVAAAEAHTQLLAYTRRV